MLSLHEPCEQAASRASHPSEQTKRRGRGVETLLVLVLLALALVFSHGCHGDQDTELLSRGWWVLF